MQTRRDFLRSVGVGAGALALSAAGEPAKGTLHLNEVVVFGR